MPEAVTTDQDSEPSEKAAEQPQLFGGKMFHLVAGTEHAKTIAKLGGIARGKQIQAMSAAAVKPNYVSKRLMRVRRQLDKLDAMLQAETDAQKLDRLASAQARLAKQEQELSGRFIPGTIRSSGRRSKRNPDLDSL